MSLIWLLLPVPFSLSPSISTYSQPLLLHTPTFQPTEQLTLPPYTFSWSFSFYIFHVLWSELTLKFQSKCYFLHSIPCSPSNQLFHVLCTSQIIFIAFYFAFFNLFLLSWFPCWHVNSLSPQRILFPYILTACATIVAYTLEWKSKCFARYKWKWKTLRDLTVLDFAGQQSTNPPLGVTVYIGTVSMASCDVLSSMSHSTFALCYASPLLVVVLWHTNASLNNFHKAVFKGSMRHMFCKLSWKRAKTYQ